LGENVSKYYDLDKIKPYRFIAIDNAIKKFKRQFNIKHFPIDCVEIAKQINNDKKANIRIQSTDNLENNVHGRTIYLRNNDFYLIAINKNEICNSSRVKYPFKYSSDRRLNFTLAHEFGHIFLEHGLIPDNEKEESLKEEEDYEANEFAGRLLMPKNKIEKCNFANLSKVATKFLVSDQALYKRLVQLRNEEKLSTPIDVCPHCWNINIQHHFNYCSICGIQLTNKEEVFTMHYTDGYNLDHEGRAFPCPRCGNSQYHDEDELCRICGVYLINACTNDYCHVDNLNDGNARYCYNCGSQSSFLSYGILNEWHLSKEAILKIQDFEEEICGVGNEPSTVENWYALINELSKFSGTRLSQLLEFSEAKYFKNNLIIYVKTKHVKSNLEQDKYTKALITYSNDYFNLNIEDIHIISFEEYLPEINAEDNNLLPF
jgi:IrrE N-terminal-like domain